MSWRGLALRQSGRALLDRPTGTVLAVLTVAAGIAASTGAFVLVHAALLTPLPFQAPDQLVSPEIISPQGFSISLSIPNYLDLRARNRSFTTMATETPWTLALSGRGPARVLTGRKVFDDFFRVLGFRAERGRVFSAAETRRGAAPVAVLGHAFYRELGGQPDLIGSVLTLDQHDYTIIGVLPPGVGFPTPEVNLYLPLGAFSDTLPWQDRDSSFGSSILARLRPGARPDAVQRDLDRIAREISVSTGGPEATFHYRTLEESLVGDLRRPLLLLFAAGALVVCMAVANVTNLFLARSAARRDEFAVRSALGAPRGEALRLVLAESVWVCGLGVASGVALAAQLVRLLAARVHDRVPSFVAARFHLGLPGVGFAVALGIVLAALIAALAAAFLARSAASSALSGERTSAGRGANRLRSLLVVTQLAVELVMLVGAGLLTESLQRLRAVEKGFDAAGVATVALAPPDRHFRSRGAWLAFHHALLAAAERISGARSASLELLLPLSNRSWEMDLLREGGNLDPRHGDSVLYNVVSPAYFTTLGAPIVRGRGFGPSDGEEGLPVAIVDESLARRYWPGEDPIGHRIAIDSELTQRGGARNRTVHWRTIVGVIKNVRHYQLQQPARIEIYIPYEQVANWDINLTLAVRTDRDVNAVLSGLPGLVATIDPEVPTTRLQALSASVDRALIQPQLLATTVGTLGSLALLLAGVGVFALATFSVTQRQQELAIRQALGATPRDLFAAVLRKGVAWCGWALLVGLPVAAIASRAARTLLFGVTEFDPAANAVAIAILLAIVMVACLAPALRAMRSDPVRFLRAEFRP